MATFYGALGSQYRLELVTTEDVGSINVSNNTSEVDYALYIRKLSGSGRWTFTTNTWQINIDGWTATGAFTYDFRNYSLLLLTSGTRTITHNADGSKTISSSGTFYDQSANLGAGTASGSLTLSTIPRASTSTFESGGSVVTSWDDGDAITIDTNRASSGFTHTLEYAFAGLTAQPIATGVGASVSWTPPLSLLDLIPSALSATLTLTTKTYNGGTYIGVKTTALTLRVPAGSAFEPDFGTITNSETVTAVSTNVGAYVQNFSKLALAITSPTEAYSSPIVSFTITAAGQTITAQSGTTPAPLAASGTVAIVGTVTDARGRTHSETVNVSVLAHSLPSVAGVQFRRSLSGGTLDENGTYVRADLNVASRSLIVSAVEKNTLKIEMFTRLRGESSWGAAAATINPVSNTYLGDFAFGIYSVGSSYDLLMKLTDVLGAVTDVNGTITTAGIFVHFGGRGEGIGIGKYWEQGSVDAKGQMFQNDGREVADEDVLSLLIPSGTMVEFAGTTQPSQWLFCNGQSLVRADYPTLFAAIGVVYGAADSTHFNVPDKRGRVSVGFDSTQTEFDTLGETGGAKTHTLTVAEMPSHQHTQRLGGSITTTNQVAGGPVVGFANDSLVSATGGGSAHNNLQPYIAVNHIIKI